MMKFFLLFCAAAVALQAQAPVVSAVVNTENETSTVLCPGLLATIYGTGFGSGSATSVVVLVGGQRGFVISVSPSQVNVQLPFNAPLGATSVVVTTGGGSSAPFNVTLASVAPTITLAPGSTSEGLFYTLKNVQVTPASLANPGDTLSLYATGLGATTGGAVTAHALRPDLYPKETTDGDS